MQQQAGVWLAITRKTPWMNVPVRIWQMVGWKDRPTDRHKIFWSSTSST